MAAPLSPTPRAALNYSTPSANLRHETYDAQKPAPNSENRSSDDDGDSSPFLSHIKDEITSTTPRGPSPPKPRPGSRIFSSSELSPLKILQQQQQSHIQLHTQTQQPPQPAVEEVSSPAKSMPPPPLPQSPRKPGPIKRFPVKVSQPGSAGSESPRRSQEERRSSGSRPPSLDSVPENQELKHAIDIFEDEVNAMHDGEDDGDNGGEHTSPTAHDAGYHEQSHMAEEDHSAVDDTMISTFSAYAGVPNLTMLANMRSDSPTRYSMGGATPRNTGPAPTRTPRGSDAYDSTANLMDFTEQMRYGAYGAQPTPSRRGGQMPPSSARTPNGAAATPQRNNLVNLLDFDIPPAPTPRSMPTITPRELESLKSGFLSEISSLKASLSGKEAEVLSLKTAVGDAEKRVGQCLEQLREIEGSQESLQTERDSWERRGREMESVLRKVKEEIVMSQREREELEFKLDEAEKRREAAEMMAQDAESKMAGMRAGKASAEASAASPAGVPSNREVELAVERVARELHALYKSKHETKVAALKKSYESRWEKQVRKLQAQVDQLSQDNDELRHNSRVSRNIDPARLHEMEEERRAERARDAAVIREREAEVDKVEAVLRTVQADNAELRVLLERERVEKGELVMLAEEMMNMQSQSQSFVAAPVEERKREREREPEPERRQSPPRQERERERERERPQQQQQQHQQHQQQQHQPMMQQAKTPNRRLSSSYAAAPSTARTPGTVSNGVGGGSNNNNNFRMSTGPSAFRASGLRAPGGFKPAAPAGESRIGRMAHERTKSAAVMGSGIGNGVGSGVGRPGSGQGLRSSHLGIMSSIEKMGGGGGYGRRGE
jgi:peptidoglycan hydrolase CwlO-like protein